MRRLALTGVVLALSAGAAAAAVPVNDAAVLDKKTETSGAVIKLVPVTTNRAKTNDCVKKAVTTGQKAPAKDSAVPKNVAGGKNTVQQFDPGSDLAKPAGSSAGVGQQATLFEETSGVVGGVTASQGTVTATGQVYQGLAGQVGSAGNVMQAFDQNSGVRVQNAMTWNNVTGAMNLLAQAWNLANIVSASDTSQSALALQTPVPPGSGGGACPAGMTGAGTAQSPCRSATCSATALSVTPDPGCVSRRYIDTRGNVAFYLAHSVEMFASMPATPVAAAPAVSSAEMAAALQRYQQHK